MNEKHGDFKQPLDMEQASRNWDEYEKKLLERVEANSDWGDDHILKKVLFKLFDKLINAINKNQHTCSYAKH